MLKNIFPSLSPTHKPIELLSGGTTWSYHPWNQSQTRLCSSIVHHGDPAHVQEQKCEWTAQPQNTPDSHISPYSSQLRVRTFQRRRWGRPMPLSSRFLSPNAHPSKRHKTHRKSDRNLNLRAPILYQITNSHQRLVLLRPNHVWRKPLNHLSRRSIDVQDPRS